ncbi:PREDICTED: basic 7S globulin-like [Nicotiana attenuata]|uniref:Basic 7s globulin n=1 Tax=Nicotiana attenuata TaxID=49451 RepID=A0A1J6JD20_NICAT|nr:PREDICTED: basic 7S globulin-like [Nicotiana attenuata]OIT04977.1 basic 7s globulin [Nicotiana attenuata]
MAFSSYYLMLICSLLLSISSCIGQTSFQPKALLLPVTKDSSTLQYITQISQRTPLVPIKLTIHLGGQTLWVDCEDGYVSSTYRPARCGSAQCTLAKVNTCGDCNTTPRIGCSNNACYNTPENPFIKTLYDGGEITEDVLSVQSTDGSNPGKFVNIPSFIFTCVPTFLTEGLASGVKGTVGLGRNDIALPSQLAQVFSFPRKFAICLSSSTKSSGVIFFGDGPHMMLPNIDVSKNLIFTPLITNPFGTGSVPFLNESSSEYFIGVKSIRVNGKPVPINKKLLSIDKRGNGGTKISTGSPYTILETSMYDAVTKVFIEELSNVTKVAAVAPFETCFSSKDIGSTRVGPAVPAIDLVLQSKQVYWRIFGANSMVEISQDVICLGFVNGGVKPTTSIVVGGYQLEDNLLQFDLPRSTLGFSSSLLFRQTTCANFNFTSKA